MNKTAAILLLCTAIFAQQKGTFTDSRDKKIYKTVKIGEQVWMAENLNYEVEGSKCYKNTTENCDKYGRLYNWETAMKSCPAGWHLPSKAEWEVLVTTAGGEKIAGKYLKATSGWNDYAGKSGNGEDKFGFSALPGGFGSLVNDDFNMKVGYGGHWWSSSEINKLDAHARYIYNDFEKVYYNEGDKIGMYSVRCLQDPAPPKGEAK
ncbi:MAG: fibrobacter succinogenes major paralogous domain-containing protein [Fibromonadaceae bacterium]|jgi:uncharacterized protein (TIGR02145 family)|nr:fibrobacter succinogenes major paralogous domain-containing protein [Fibromonadaceae bacterium]